MKEIRESDTLRKRWEKYSHEYEYAKDISFDDTCNTIQTIMDTIVHTYWQCELQGNRGSSFSSALLL